MCPPEGCAGDRPPEAGKTVGFEVGPVIVASRLVLAPLAGYTDLPFRLLCRELGAGLCYSEMISGHGLVRGQQSTRHLLRTIPADRPLALQLFGADPDIMAAAATIAAEQPVDIIDINMGCPAKKVVKKGAGAALMKNPAVAEKIIASVVRATRLPVTVKIRAGWDHSSINAIELARIAEGAGAQAIAIHPRTWRQGFGGHSDWTLIGRIKQAVRVPVIGNGDVLSRRQADDMLTATGCDAVMIGRGALGNPWIFSPLGPPAELAGRCAGALRHFQLLAAHADPESTLGRVKSQACKYFTGIPGSAAIRRRIFATGSFADLRNLLEDSADPQKMVANVSQVDNICASPMRIGRLLCK